MVGLKGTAADWHDVECGSYEADLPLWRELAAGYPGPLLDLGCGTGRVALDLAGRGHEVTGLDSDPDLVSELAVRARARGLALDAVTEDARTFALGRRFALVIAPMQVVQLLGGSEGRRACLARVRNHLDPGGAAAIALADPFEGMPLEDVLPPLPDVREQEDGWVLSSTPLRVRAESHGVAVERLRQAVSPKGELSEGCFSILLDSVGADELEAEGRETGLRPVGRRHVEETRDHVGSTVVVMEAP